MMFKKKSSQHGTLASPHQTCEGITCTYVSIKGLENTTKRVPLTVTASSSVGLLANAQSDNYIYYIEQRM